MKAIERAAGGRTKRAYHLLAALDPCFHAQERRSHPPVRLPVARVELCRTLGVGERRHIPVDAMTAICDRAEATAVAEQFQLQTEEERGGRGRLTA